MEIQYPDPEGSPFVAEMGAPSFGEILLSQHLHAQTLLRQSSYLDRLSFIEACLRSGITSEHAITATASAIGGDNDNHGLSAMLQWHSMPTARPHLWDRTVGDEFVLRETTVA